MSLIFRVLKFHNCLNKTGNFLINNAYISERHSRLCSKLPLHLSSNRIFERRLSAQHLQPKNDLSQPQSRNIEQDFQYVDSIIRRGNFLSMNTFKTLLKEVTHAKELTPSQALFLLNCCGSSVILENKVVRRKLTKEVTETLKTKGISWDVSHYNSLLQNYLENDIDFSPSEFLAMLEEKNITPNRVTYGRLIAKFCQKGDIESANKILEYMKNEGMEISEPIFCSLILGNARAKDLEGTVSLLDIMKQSKIGFGPATYAALIQAYSENGKVDEIERILSEGLKDGSLQNSSLLEIVSLLTDDLDASIINKVLSCFNEKEGSPISLIKHTSARLLSSGYDELAYRIYKTQPREEQCFIGSYFPKLLVSSNIDFHKVVSYCENLRNTSWNIISFEIALEAYLREGNFKSAMALMREMKDRGITIKEHYFYPIMANCGEEGDKERVLAMLEDILKFEISLSVDFYSTFLVPFLDNSNISKIDSNFHRLMNYPEVRAHQLFNGYVDYLLRSFDIDITAQFVKLNPRGIMHYLSPLLSDVYLKTLNSEAAAQILYYFLPFEVRLQREFVEEDLESKYSGIKTFFQHTIGELRRKDMQDTHILSLLKAMQSEGVYLVPSVKELLIRNLGEFVNSDIEEILEKLSDTSLINSVEIKGLKPSLHRQIEESEADGQINEDLNIRLFYNLIRQNRPEEAEAVVQKLKSNNVALPPNVKVQLINFYIESERFEEAETLYNEMLEIHPEFQINPSRVIKIAKMLVNKGKIEDAIKCILINSPENGEWLKDFKFEFSEYYYKNYLNALLNALVEKSDLASLKRMQEALLSRNFASAQVVMPSLVEYHIQQNNIEEAISCYKNFAKEYGITAGKLDLTVACIKEEDTDRLQQVLDVSNDIHGEQNTLYDLVFAFLEIGKVVQAERVLQTSGMRSRAEKLYDQCKFYVRTNRIEQLKNFIKISRNVFGINREKLYGFLLEAYIAADDPDNCLGIWTTMQEENLIPNDNFLAKLGNYLRSKGRDVPFRISSQTLNEETEEQFLKDEIWAANRKRDMKKLNHLVAENKRDCAKFSVNFLSEIILTFMNHGNMSRVIELTEMMLMQNRYPYARLFRKILEELKLNGNVATIQHFGKYMDTDLRKLTNYQSYLTSAMVEAGQGKELMEVTSKLAEQSDLLSEDDVVLTRASFSKILQKHPELYQDAKNLAEKVKNSNNPQMLAKSLSFVEALFSHNFVTGNHDEAEKIYEENLKDQDSFILYPITNHCYRESNIEMLEKLIQVIDRKPEGRENMKGFAYSAYIDILRKEKKFEEALNFIEKSLKSVELQQYRNDSLIKLQKDMKANSLSFPYDIPHKKVKEESSSSSSDSDNVR